MDTYQFCVTWLFFFTD